jgi:hypothetical protein
MLSDLPFDAPDTPAGWLAAVGTWLAVLSFPLPWVASPFLSWFAAWGFTPTANLVPFLLALVVAFGSITPSRLPPRLRLGYGPLAVGLVGLGIAWGAVVLLSGAGIGVWVLVVGAVLATAGGGWTVLRRDRVAGLL